MTENEELVKNMADNFQNKGLEILYAMCNGYNEPADVQGVKPDIIGWDSEQEIYHLGIVADSETITFDSTKEKMEILAKMLEHQKENICPFMLELQKMQVILPIKNYKKPTCYLKEIYKKF